MLPTLDLFQVPALVPILLCVAPILVVAGPPAAPFDSSFAALKEAGTGEALCALTDPSALLAAPSRIGCAAQCAALLSAGSASALQGDGAAARCLGFNYVRRQAGAGCQLFLYAPNAFAPLNGCAFYGVGGIYQWPRC